jgi:hypothetical protein
VPHTALQPLLPPLRFTPIPKARPWGASRLAALGKGGVGGATIGESWEVADLPDAIVDGQSTVDGGPLAGRTLRALREANGRALLGIATRVDDVVVTVATHRLVVDPACAEAKDWPTHCLNSRVARENEQIAP